jgi:hypothetical protein
MMASLAGPLSSKRGETGSLPLQEAVDFLANGPFETPPNYGGSSGRAEKAF